MDGDRADCRQREHSRGRSLRCRGVFQELSVIRVRDFGDALATSPQINSRNFAPGCPETVGRTPTSLIICKYFPSEFLSD